MFMYLHAQKRIEDGFIEIPAGDYVYNEIKEEWMGFKHGSHNVMLSLVANNVNSFGVCRFISSVWLIYVINNNLPPWMSIKREHIMLEIIVLGI